VGVVGGGFSALRERRKGRHHAAEASDIITTNPLLPYQPAG